MSAAASSSARLQEITKNGMGEATTTMSSPLARKSRQSEAAASVRSTRSTRRRSTRGVTAEDEDELSPDKSVDLPPGNGESPDISLQEEPEELPTLIQTHDNEEEDDEIAQEVNETEAARSLGKTKSRHSIRMSSPELGSQDNGPGVEVPAPKRRRKQVQASPAKQKQGQLKPKDKPKAKPAKEKAPTGTKKRKSREAEDEGDTGHVEIAVQRFTKGTRQGEEDPDADDLMSDIPFASRGGVNSIDVLSQFCDDMIEKSLNEIRQGRDNAEDSSTRKEYRVKLRAVEAFREELRTRLVQHVCLTTLASQPDGTDKDPGNPDRLPTRARKARQSSAKGEARSERGYSPCSSRT
jgi:hypothetical protein